MFGLARELYGGTPWMMHGQMFAAYSQILIDERNNISRSYEEKLNSIRYAEISSSADTPIFKKGYDDYGNPLKPQKNSVAVTTINGPITKGGGASSRGMKEISNDLLTLDSDENIIGHIIQIDSGGGSATGMELMSYTIKSLKKPVVGLVERAGMAASAAYGILSSTDWAMAEDFNSEVGSIGTMISFAGYPAGDKDFMGARHITAYATKSTAKNKAFEEAINTGKTELIISEILDPFNERFLASTKQNRPNILETQLDGSMYSAGEVVGTMVDQIGSFTDAVNKILELSKATPTFNAKNKQSNKSAMTAQEFKSQHPEAYAEVFGEGRTAGMNAERERVKSWQHYASVDPELVNKGITEGREISASEREGLLVKIASGGNLKNLQQESAANVVTPEATGAAAELSADEKAWKAQYPNVPFVPSVNAN